MRVRIKYDAITYIYIYIYTYIHTYTHICEQALFSASCPFGGNHFNKSDFVCWANSKTIASGARSYLECVPWILNQTLPNKTPGSWEGMAACKIRLWGAGIICTTGKSHCENFVSDLFTVPFANFWNWTKCFGSHVLASTVLSSDRAEKTSKA